MFRLLFIIGFLLSFTAIRAQTDSLSQFTHWQTGHDPETKQVIPKTGDDPIAIENGIKIVHVKFRVRQYGEVSFPIDPSTPRNTEAKRVDITGSKSIKITYKSNQQFVLQLRQTGVHGGIHNHVTLPPSENFKTIEIPFTAFQGGRTPLDLSDVAKFNFAFLSNNSTAGFAELVVRSVVINRPESYRDR